MRTNCSSIGSLMQNDTVTFSKSSWAASDWTSRPRAPLRNFAIMDWKRRKSHKYVLQVFFWLKNSLENRFDIDPNWSECTSTFWDPIWCTLDHFLIRYPIPLENAFPKKYIKIQWKWSGKSCAVFSDNLWILTQFTECGMSLISQVCQDVPQTKSQDPFKCMKITFFTAFPLWF